MTPTLTRFSDSGVIRHYGFLPLNLITGQKLFFVHTREWFFLRWVLQDENCNFSKLVEMSITPNCETRTVTTLHVKMTINTYDFVIHVIRLYCRALWIYAVAMIAAPFASVTLYTFRSHRVMWRWPLCSYQTYCKHDLIITCTRKIRANWSVATGTNAAIEIINYLMFTKRMTALDLAHTRYSVCVPDRCECVPIHSNVKRNDRVDNCCFVWCD